MKYLCKLVQTNLRIKQLSSLSSSYPFRSRLSLPVRLLYPKLANHRFIQSMSQKKCLDNTPLEKFFTYLRQRNYWQIFIRTKT